MEHRSSTLERLEFGLGSCRDIVSFSFKCSICECLCYVMLALFDLCGVYREYWFLRVYLLVFLTLLTLFSYCAHFIASST